MKICLVVTNYYPSISKELMNGALKVLKKNRIKNFKTIIAPGVFEIPVIISRNINKFDAFVALACVIKGQTPHFNFISTAATNSIMDLSIKYKKPIGNGIITCLNQNQAMERASTTKKNKGGEAVKATLSVLGVLNK